MSWESSESREGAVPREVHDAYLATFDRSIVLPDRLDKEMWYTFVPAEKDEGSYTALEPRCTVSKSLPPFKLDGVRRRDHYQAQKLDRRPMILRKALEGPKHAPSSTSSPLLVDHHLAHPDLTSLL
jgi:hypothetical protein